MGEGVDEEREKTSSPYICLGKAVLSFPKTSVSGNSEYEVARVLRAGQEPQVEKMQVWSGRHVDI